MRHKCVAEKSPFHCFIPPSKIGLCTVQCTHSTKSIVANCWCIVYWTTHCSREISDGKLQCIPYNKYIEYICIWIRMCMFELFFSSSSFFWIYVYCPLVTHAFILNHACCSYIFMCVYMIWVWSIQDIEGRTLTFPHSNFLINEYVNMHLYAWINQLEEQISIKNCTSTVNIRTFNIVESYRWLKKKEIHCY